jgi:hypothetical protein
MYDLQAISGVITFDSLNRRPRVSRRRSKKSPPCKTDLSKSCETTRRDQAKALVAAKAKIGGILQVEDIVIRNIDSSERVWSAPSRSKLVAEQQAAHGALHATINPGGSEKQQSCHKPKARPRPSRVRGEA